MLGFAEKLTKTPYKMVEADTQALRAVGLTDTEILQTTLIASWFNYINRVADALGVGKSA
jgi:alkylhydroperoxidase family enzyme